MDKGVIFQKLVHLAVQKGIVVKFAPFSNVTQIPLPKLNLALNGKRRLTFDEYELICGAVNVGTDKFLEPKKPELVK